MGVGDNIRSANPLKQPRLGQASMPVSWKDGVARCAHGSVTRRLRSHIGKKGIPFNVALTYSRLGAVLNNKRLVKNPEGKEQYPVNNGHKISQCKHIVPLVGGLCTRVLPFAPASSLPPRRIWFLARSDSGMRARKVELPAAPPAGTHFPTVFQSLPHRPNCLLTRGPRPPTQKAK